MSHYKHALEIIDTLHHKGFTAYFAGGWVRDHLLGHTPDDIDIATDASVDELKVIFPHTIEVGVLFGIIIVVIENDHFEVATFRRESGYEDGRRPTQIEACDPEEDAKRRDFTINGMFYDPLSEEVLDYVDGRIDLNQKIIRAIGNPKERFEEDRLRMIRAIRYACRFDFAIEPKTYEAIKAYAPQLFPSVAIERVYQEFNKMANFPNFEKALVKLHEVGLLQQIFPKLNITQDRLKDQLRGLENVPLATPTSAKLTLLFPHLLQDELYQILKELKISNKEISIALYFAHLKKEMIENHPLSRYTLAQLFADPNFELCFEMMKALPISEETINHFVSQHIELAPHIERLQMKSPVVSASFLISHGVTPGERLGKLLKQAEEISIEQNIDSPEEIYSQLNLSNDQ